MAVQNLVKKSTDLLRARPKTSPNATEPVPPRNLLSRIESPADLRSLTIKDLPDVAEEVRQFLLDSMSRHGGHLASNLGVVDLTIALHYSYDTPRDMLFWDVGHQAYAHKILTGRRGRFETLRQYGGISGFPRISESEYDTVSTGHASTSISSALGAAIGRDLRGEKHEVIALIGDGALTGGLAFEGLNNLGSQATKMTVVLNDNKMSISQNVGALSRYLTRVITDRRFHKIKTDLWELLGNVPQGKRIRSLVHSVDDALRHFVIPGKLFEDLGLRYFGPVDGHNIAEMVEVFRFVRDTVTEPAFVHVITTKGKGYSFAEHDATKFHGVSRFSLSTGTVLSAPSKAPTFSEIFGKTLTQIARTRKDVVAITAAMPDGTGLASFQSEFPKRFFDVGIAEGHAVTFAAGLARKGLKPVVALYSTFLQRAYDQLIHDVALDKTNVVFCIDRAGLVGEDGPTHHGMFDLSFLRTIPNAVIMAPRDEGELRSMLYTAIEAREGPIFIRYPRGYGSGKSLDMTLSGIPLCQPEVIREGSGCVVVAVGNACTVALEACELLDAQGIKPGCVNARFVKPLDEAFYRNLCTRYSTVVTLEYNTIAGGFGSGVLELLSSFDKGPAPRVLRLGLPDQFIEHGATEILHAKLGLDGPGVAARIRDFVNVRG